MIFYILWVPTPDTLATPDTISDYYLVANVIIDILNTVDKAVEIKQWIIL